MATRETGNVKWFNDAKGYGFIQREIKQGCVCALPRHFVAKGRRSLAEQQVEYAVVSGGRACRRGCGRFVMRICYTAGPMWGGLAPDSGMSVTEYIG